MTDQRSAPRCAATHNPGRWPYITRCLLMPHGDDVPHRDRFGDTWMQVVDVLPPADVSAHVCSRVVTVTLAVSAPPWQHGELIDPREVSVCLQQDAPSCPWMIDHVLVRGDKLSYRETHPRPSVVVTLTDARTLGDLSMVDYPPWLVDIVRREMLVVNAMGASE